MNAQNAKSNPSLHNAHKPKPTMQIVFRKFMPGVYHCVNLTRAPEGSSRGGGIAMDYWNGVLVELSIGETSTCDWLDLRSAAQPSRTYLRYDD